jgi:hypothetical protein
MKELTIEEKVKAYDEAIKKAKGVIEQNPLMEYLKKGIEYILPELKENEDERIRKEIVSAINIYCSEYHRGTKVRNDMLDWLEKQGQVKDSCISQHENKTCKENGNSLTSEDIRKGLIQYFSTFTLDTFAGLDPKKILAWLEAQGEHAKFRNKIQVGDKVTRNRDGMLVNLSQLKRVAKKQGEQKKELLQELDDKVNNALENETPESLGKFLDKQKPADKVEPKFKVGDWGVNTVGDTNQVVKVWEDGYTLDNDTFLSNSWATEHYHRWTIQDAKDGDVLATIKGGVFIYAKVLYNKPYAYCGVDKFGVFKDNCLNNNWTNSVDNIHPATKEQRDTLMKAMADAGYTFDFEKKELKKIVTPKFNVHDCIIKKHNSNINDFGPFIITDITGGKY